MDNRIIGSKQWRAVFHRNKQQAMLCSCVQSWRKSGSQIHLRALCSVQFCAVFVQIQEIILCKHLQISASICIWPLILAEIKDIIKEQSQSNIKLQEMDYSFHLKLRENNSRDLIGDDVKDRGDCADRISKKPSILPGKIVPARRLDHFK